MLLDRRSKAGSEAGYDITARNSIWKNITPILLAFMAAYVFLVDDAVNSVFLFIPVIKFFPLLFPLPLESFTVMKVLVVRPAAPEQWRQELQKISQKWIFRCNKALYRENKNSKSWLYSFQTR